MAKSNSNHKPAPPSLAQITLRAFLKSAPKPGSWVSLRTWVDAANLVSKKLDGVEVTALTGGRLLREAGFEMKHRNDGPWVGVTKAGLRALEKAGLKALRELEKAGGASK